MSYLGRLKCDLELMIVLSKYISYSKIAFETGVSLGMLFIAIIVSSVFQHGHEHKINAHRRKKILTRAELLGGNGYWLHLQTDAQDI